MSGAEMPVIPHPTKEKTWVIDYVTAEGENRKFHQVEFTGPLKDALLQERKLHKPGRGNG